MRALHFAALSPAGRPDARLAIAASRAGALGVVDLTAAATREESAEALEQLARHAGGRRGVLIAGAEQIALLPVGMRCDAVLVAPPAGEGPEPAVRAARERGAEVMVVATGVHEAVAAAAAGADAVVAKGDEAGGWIGTEGTFVLLQRVLAAVGIPVWAQGGIGLHTVAACRTAGAAGVVLDGQLLLTRETPLPEPVKARIAALDGGETVRLGDELGAAVRVYSRPDLAPVQELRAAAAGAAGDPEAGAAGRAAWREAVRARLGWERVEDQVLAVGQDACFAADLARRFVTVGGVLAALRDAAGDDARSAAALRPFAEGAPLATAHGTRYPIVQGPMTRVSDRASFAAAVAEGGALPFLALALMRAPEVTALLAETQERLGGRPWGVGILGFVPAALRAEQLESLHACRPPFALIAGGRPDQARELEADGTTTYLHVPSPGLLELYLRDGARRFVFEGRECGGHVGPRSSLVLWDTMVRGLLAAAKDVDPREVHVLLAGGIHDARSAAMAATVAAPLAARGMKVGCLMGTGYLFTEEAVRAGAITDDFQAAARRASDTVLLESGPGHATRCLASPFAEEFLAEKRRLTAAGTGAAELRDALEQLNIGRLRIAAKGTDRNPARGADPEAPRLVDVGPEERWERGLYMIGQVAALRDDVLPLADLHRDVAEGSSALLEAAAPAGARVVAEPGPPPADVAIVGMACILPEAPDLARFWANVLAGVDAITEVPEDRFDWRQYFDADRTAKDKIYSRWGGFIPDMPFDPVAFGMPPNSLRSIEPFQVLGLMTARSALDDAGYRERPFARDRTSVILGAGGGGAALGVGYTARSMLPSLFGDAAPELAGALGESLPEWTEDSFPGLLMNVAAGRIANRLDLGGVNYTVDAACASALAAVTAGARDLETGTSDMVIVGGVDAIQTPFAYLCFAKTHALSPNGRCRPFDADADGIAISEGFAAVVLKRRADAERDGDRIYALVRGLGAASDGRDRSLTAPRPEGQMRALERAYEHAGVSPATVGLVEAHGTGTVAGDGAEVKALAAVYSRAGASQQGCAIGSVKSMIGHTKATAGVAGLIKATLALHHRVLPPTIGVTQPNPKAGFDASPFYVNTETRPWVHASEEHPRRAAVSAFGFGGTNFHVVLEEYTGDFLGTDGPALDTWPAELVVLRAGSREALRERVDALLGRLAGAPPPALGALARECARSAARTTTGQPTLAVVAGTIEELAARLATARDALAGAAERLHDAAGVHFAETPLAGEGAIAFLFPGQGSQSVGMLRDVVTAFPGARAAFERADRALAGRFEHPLSRYVFPPPAFDDAARAEQAEALTDTHVAQPALGAADLAMLGVLRSFGVEPAMTAGHSYGELVALAAAGSLDEETLLQLSEARGRFIREEAKGESGCMVAVSAGAGQLAPLLDGDLVVANVNAPAQTVLSGSAASVDRALAWCAEHGFGARKLPVACAFHSRYVEAAQQRLAQELRAAGIAAPRIPVFSNTTGAAHPQDPATITALLSEHLVRPVEFVRELEAMYDAGARIFVEVGPRNVLSRLADQTLGDRPHLAIATDRPGRHGVIHLLHCLAGLVAEGAPVDLERLFAGRTAGTQPATPLTASTWLVNAAHARPAAAGEPPPAAPPPVRVALAGAPSQNEPEPEQQGTVPVLHTPPVHENGAAGLPPALAPPNGSPPGPEPMLAPRGAAADAMRGYHELMERFLDTERSVMLTYLSGGHASAPNGGVAPAARRPLAPVASLPAGPPAVPVAQAPPVTVPAGSAAPANGASAANGAAVADHTARPNGSGPAGAPISREELTSRLLDVVAERTGYPTDMLDLDADVEADLSIDSIKRVEIAGTIMETLTLPEGATLDAEQMTASRTLREVVDVLEALVRNEAPPALVAAPAGTEEDAPPFAREPTESRIGRFVLKVAHAPAADATAALAEAGAVVVVDDGTGIGSAVATRLRSAGHPVVRLTGGDEGGDEATPCPPGDVAALRAAARTAAERHGGVKALVHLGALAPGGAAISAQAPVPPALAALLALAQELHVELDAAAAGGGAVVLGATAMGGTFGVEGDVTPAAAGHGMVTGFLKTLAHEWPAVRVKALDLGEGAPGELAEAVVAELLAADALVEIGRRDGERITLALEPAPLVADGDAPLEPGAVLLVTGGARGITAEAAVELARRHRPTVVLVGRTPAGEEDPELAALDDPQERRRALLARLRAADPSVKPAAVEAQHRRLEREREVRATLARLREHAAAVEHRVCDVGDAEAFAALLDDVRTAHGRIDGVIHGAGVIEDKLIADKDPASLERVVRTKVTGALVLAERLRPDELRFLILFSSVSGRFGNRGQADYAAASEALNKLARALDRAWPARVTAIDWGPWQTTGMASDLVQRQFAERGVELIDVATGCRMLDEELCRGAQGAPEVLIGGGQVAAPVGLHALLADGATLRRRGDGLEVQRELSVARDTYLGDHRLDGRAVLPFAVATELMAEAAAAAAPGREVVELAGIRLFDGITVDDDAAVTARIVAEPAGTDLDVTIAGDGVRPRYRARARFAAHPDPAVARHGLDALAAFPLGVSEAYAAYLFHGPLFQRIVSISGMDERGARAVVRACPPAQCIAGAGAARWWLDPIAMDCALQLQVLWARLNWGVTLLPAQIGCVRRLGPLEGEALHLELRIRPGSAAPLCHADHVFRAPDGTVLGELEDVVGTGSRALNRLAGPPRTGRFTAEPAAAPHPAEAFS